MALRKLFVKKKEEKFQLFSGKSYVPIAACGAMFLANWYIQRNPFSSAVKMIVHRAAGITGILASIGEIKDGILSLIKERKAADREGDLRKRPAQQASCPPPHDGLPV